MGHVVTVLKIRRNVRHHCRERNTLLCSTLSCFKTNLCEFLHVFYICSSVHRNSMLKKSNRMRQFADIYLLLNYSTCFGRPSHSSSGVHKTVVAASGTDHTVWGASCLKRDQISPYLVMYEEAEFPDSMICTRGFNYSFMYP